MNVVSPSTATATVPGRDAHSRPFTVCHLAATNFFGGPEKQIVELSTELVHRGWKVVIGSFREGRQSVELTETAAGRGLETFLIDTRSRFSPLAVRQLIAWLRKHRVEILVTHGYKATAVGHLAARRMDVRHVPMARGYTREDRKVRLYETLDRAVLRRSTRVFCVSEAMREDIHRMGVTRERVTVIHNAIDCDGEIRPLDLRREFGFDADARVIVAAGRLSPEKGHADLVDAMGHVVRREPRARLVILGDGPRRSALEDQIARSDLGGRVVLGGFRRPILPMLAGADLVVNPSRMEGLPNVVLESMRVRTPVVATDVGGVRELIVSGETGWLTPAGSPESLASAMVEALGHGSRARSMADAAFSRVVTRFSPAGQADTFATACADLFQLGSAS